ncbi:ATP-binding cassette domain-containing protein [Candidatus Gracilibacteria bacterium]|nr:ATP-binding cassette domain-containing protein [Candidatus Gracilibacteria bacterium]MCF7898602.1 ATP-binding cassette domain-containing protein [Candidatus Paceibacterota bacterium]
MKTYNINHHFGGIQALNDVSIFCEEGKITGLIGPNGSGKSTLVNVLTNVLHRMHGKVENGKHFARTFQDAKLWSNLTVLESFLMAQKSESWLYSIFHFSSLEEIKSAKEIIERIELTHHTNTKVRNLSYGQRKLVEIGRALSVTNSQILYLDEPFAGLSDISTPLVKDLILEEKKKGKVVLIIEHDMNIIRTLCDYVYVLDAGKVIAEGTPDECLNNKEVKEAYLGL